ncbi:MAG: hypothetical protein ABW252_15300 [Polyangiales bacterium]
MAHTHRHASFLGQALLVGGLVLGAANAVHAQATPQRRVNLQVLVISTGALDFGTAMVKAGLDETLVPYSEIDLTNFSRPRLSESFLVDTGEPSVRTARFQAVVMPNDAPSALSPAELEALVRFEKEFKIRQLDTYVVPSSTVGLSAPVLSVTLDGATARISEAARKADFVYLPETLLFEDLDPNTFETFAYLGTPLAGLPAGRSFTTLVDVQMPGAPGPTPILGVYSEDGREQMILTASMNQYQIAQQALFPGILNWLTYGVHLGSERHFLAVHIDDVFMDDGRWSDEFKCTLNDGCPGGQTGPSIVMKPADVDFLVAWQSRQGLKLDMVFNAESYVGNLQDFGNFPLGARLLTQKSQLRWMNHTYSHYVLGCDRDIAYTPYKCRTDTRGQILYPDYKTSYDQVALNVNFARQAGIAINPAEIVTGEHSGLRRPPNEPSDNPNLVKAFTDLNVAWAGSDNSVEPQQRIVGTKTLTVPRYPMNIFYNVGTKVEETQEYNWIYGAKATGGSGLCEGKFTCFAPLDVERGFDQTIVPREARLGLLHMVSNDPRPHYAHQSNITEDRILYPVVDKILADHRRTFQAWAVPLVNPTLAESGIEMRNRADWSRGRSRVEAFVQNGAMVVNLWVSGSSTTLPVPITAPTDYTGLQPYWGVRNGWQTLALTKPLQIPLASTVGYAR